jgi:sulfonate transport system substrate-binding protein
MKKFVSLIATALIAVGLPLAAQAQENPKVVRIAFSGAGVGGKPASSGGALATAHQRGILEKEFAKDGIKVEWSFFVGAGPATNEALALKKIDFATQGDLPLVVARANGLRTRILLSGSRFSRNYVVVPTSSTIQSLEDLRGKKLTVQKGTSGQLTLNRLLEKAGLKETDLRVIDMIGDSQKAALSTGDVDAALQSSTDLVVRGLVRRIYKVDDPKLTAPSQIWVSEEFEAKYPHIVQRFVTTLVRESAWVSDEKNRDEIFRLFAKTGNPYSDYKEDYKGTELRDRFSPLLDEYYTNSLAKSIGEVKHFRFARRDAQIEGWVEPKYLQTALKELKLEGYWDEFDADGKRKKAAGK